MSQTITIQYFNVKFYIKIKKDSEKFMFNCFSKKMNSGYKIRMKHIADWCDLHEIEYCHRFFYRFDFPLKANLWNYYSYLRFLIDRKFLKLKK